MSAIGLIVLMIATGVFALIGVVFCIVGLFRKKRRLIAAGVIVAVVSMSGLAWGIVQTSKKIYAKAQQAPGQMWKSMEEAAQDDKGVQPMLPAAAKKDLSARLGNPAFLASSPVQGVWVPGVMLDYGYYLYKANAQDVLKSVASTPVMATSAIPSDASCKLTTWDQCKDRLMYPYGPQKNLAGWNPEGVAHKRCYICLRFPWEHVILIDDDTGMVYHSISEIRD